MIGQTTASVTAAVETVHDGASVTHRCDVCGQRFGWTRRDKKFCSPGCRQAAYRSRHVTDRAEFSASDVISVLAFLEKAMGEHHDHDHRHLFHRVFEVLIDLADVAADLSRDGSAARSTVGGA